MNDLATKDFARGSSPLSEKEAFGHVADKLGEIIDGLKALAERKPLKRHPGRRLSLRQTFAFVADNFTMCRDAMRSVALLRGHENWLLFARQVELLRDNFMRFDSTPLLAWPEAQMLMIAGNLDMIRLRVVRMRDRPMSQTIKATRGGLILPN